MRLRRHREAAATHLGSTPPASPTAALNPSSCIMRRDDVASITELEAVFRCILPRRLKWLEVERGEWKKQGPVLNGANSQFLLEKLSKSGGYTAEGKGVGLTRDANRSIPGKGEFYASKVIKGTRRSIQAHIEKPPSDFDCLGARRRRIL